VKLRKPKIYLVVLFVPISLIKIDQAHGTSVPMNEELLKEIEKLVQIFLNRKNIDNIKQVC